MSELRNIVDFYISLYAISNDLWNIYIVVSVGLVGFVFSKESIKKITLVLLTIVYLGFAFSNQRSLLRVQVLMHEAVAAAQSMKVQKPEANQYTKLAKSISASSPKEVRRFHTAVTTIVILLFWLSILSSLSERYRLRKTKTRET